VARLQHTSEYYRERILGRIQERAEQSAANRARAAGARFANLGVPGDVPWPIFAAIWRPGLLEFFEWDFVTNLNTGAAGTLANTLAGTGSNINFYCNMVGTGAFPACASKVGNVAGGYPINSGRSIRFPPGER